MGNIRRQTIFSSLVIYIGFIIGAINIYLYVKNGTFTKEQFGLTRLMNDLGITFFSFATLGVSSYIYKFQPFYKQNLSKDEDDQVAVSVVVALVGFSLVSIAAVLFKPLFIQKFIEKSRLLIEYYYWLLPFTFGVLFFTIFESFAWFAQKSVFSNFLKETGLRLIQLCIIILFIAGFINFSTFVSVFALAYCIVAIILVVYLLYTKSIVFNFRISRVTRKFRKKIFSLMTLIYASLVINTLSQYVDSIIIGSVSKNGLSDVGVYALATFITTTIQVPQRGIISAVIPVLSNAWKSKDYNEISRLYNRTSINLLLLALFIFSLIWLNIDALFTVLNVNEAYEAGKFVILILGLSKIIDAGTGVNAQIIGTSNYWKFEVFTGILLLAISIPLNYILVKRYGINGSAISNLIAFSVYNAVRLYFIWYKFSMQPFTLKTLCAIALAVAIYFCCALLLGDFEGWAGIIFKSALFSFLFISSAFIFKLSPDIHQLWELAVKRVKGR